VARDRVEQRLGLQRVAGAVGALGQAAVIDVVLHRGDFEAHALLGDRAVAICQHLGEVVTGVDVKQRKGNGCWPEGLGRQVQHDHGVLAAGEQQDRTFELRADLTEDVDRLGLQGVQVVQGQTTLGALNGLDRLGRWVPDRLGDGAH
jgi:hypothetical protein